MLSSSIASTLDTMQNADAQTCARILVIDDDAAVRGLIRSYLVDFGFEVVEADNGKAGLELFSTHEFDLVLVDYIMPVMDGLEFLQCVQKQNEKNTVPVLFLTGSDDKESHSKCIEYGGDDVILKPVQEYILKIKIDSWLRAKDNLDNSESIKQKLMVRDSQHEEDLLISQNIINNFTSFDKKAIKNIHVFSEAKEILSGDMVLTAISPSGNQYVMLADFTGHGLPAAIASMIVSELFYTMTNKGISITDITMEVNKKLRALLPTNRFMAACIIDINYVDKIISVMQAGLPDMYLFSSDNELLHTFVSHHPPLGILQNSNLDIKIENFDITDGSKLFLYTDGLNEAKNRKGDIFGKQRIIEAIEQSFVSFSSFNEVKSAYKQFMDGYKSFDDVTFVQVICDQSMLAKKKNLPNCESDRTAAVWSMSVSFDMNVMREIDPIPLLVNQLISLQGVGMIQEKLYLVLTELYSNSLEHGILGLDSSLKQDVEGFEKYYQLREQRMQENTQGQIDFQFHHQPIAGGGVLSINIIDNGQGFDHNSIQRTVDNAMMFSGRGVGLIQSLAKNYRYEDNGRKAHLELSWSQAA